MCLLFEIDDIEFICLIKIFFLTVISFIKVHGFTTGLYGIHIVGVCSLWNQKVPRSIPISTLDL